DIGEDTLGVFSDPRDVGRAAHQRLGERFTGADGERSGELDYEPVETGARTRMDWAWVTGCPLVVVDRIGACVLCVRNVISGCQAAGDCEPVWIVAAGGPSHVDN